MKQGTANLAEDYCFIHKALRPVGTARRQIAAVPPSNSRPATECSDYRTLSLMSHILKILLKVILKRNKHKIESVISETQSGFMAGTREGIYNLRTIIERYIKCGKNIYLCFIDYEKAFDRVKHAKIIECM